MAIGESLISGAAKANRRFVDVGGAVSKGVTASVGSGQNQNPRRSQRRGQIDNINSQVKSHIDSLNTDMDLVGMTDQEQSSIRGFLDTQRMEYAQLANQLAQTDATSPFYSQLRSQMDEIKNSFVNLANQVKTFKTRKAEYMDDFDKGLFSKGNDPEKYGLAAKVYAGGSLSIAPNGELYVLPESGDELIKYSQIKDPMLVDRKSANAILSTAEKLNKSGNLITDFEAERLKNETVELLQQEGTLESIVEDGVLSSMPLNVDLDKYETRQEAVDAVADIILKGYKDSARSGYNAKQSKINKNNLFGRNQNNTANLSKRTGYSREDRQIMFNDIKKLSPGKSYAIESFSGSNDISARRGYGAFDYTITKGQDGNFIFEKRDKKTGDVLEDGIITLENLQKELLGESVSTDNSAARFNSSTTTP